MDFPLWQFGQMILAALLGGLVGLDRQLDRKPAGLRTHILVTTGACLFGMVAEVAWARFPIDAVADEGVGRTIVSDPIRILEAVVTGIAFLGAGTIVVHRGNVEGLTTAASMLVAGGVGVAVAMHAWELAIGTTLFLLIVLRGLGWIERRYFPGDSTSDAGGAGT